MAEKVIKLPDVGEGVAEAELVEWHVKVGDLVREDTVLGAVMTDKATVEIPSPVEGKVTWLGAGIGDMVAVGSALVRLETADGGGEAETPVAAPPVAASPPPAATKKPEHEKAPAVTMTPFHWSGGGAPRPEGEKPVASPAVRLRAREAGVDLRRVHGTGPAGRITHDDLSAFIAQGPGAAVAVGRKPKTNVDEVKVVGLRRRIAEKMALAHAHIPPITYVEEVDVTALEDLRTNLNKKKRDDQPKLTLLPFLVRAIVNAVAAQPGLNGHYDDEAGVVRQHGGVHVGIATQTSGGLMVPVVRHAEARDLWDCAGEITRLSAAARDGTATREELTGSTITITSLGPLGGIVTTPIINYPEVAIVGVNKMMVRPMWNGAAFVPKKMMNLSSSFDHRVVDGYEAAVFVQRLKELLETPALLFMEG
ncbi:dihydrolipoamide acetyltransferase family protein [Xanthobacteraceae bacterium Astr-EGSB]|uniref:dihydrolipoamide acetyltransferase family protein n=1 Tax=Astrobacterium formosum TaxID=3069710 RepID=UPI0027B4AAAB|nr:dihydrolipoamide acetyltransferase family protein [Xanthobacteraceae bacterium Astr-EGSB]